MMDGKKQQQWTSAYSAVGILVGVLISHIVFNVVYL